MSKAKPQKITDNITRERVAPGIYRYISATAKIGWTLDKRNGKYFCYGIDQMIPLPGVRDKNGKAKRIRHRDKPFSTLENAQKAQARVILAEHEKKYDIVLQPKRVPTLKEVFDLLIPKIKNQNERQRALRASNVLLELLPPYYLITELTNFDTQKFTEKRISQGVKESTAVREATTLSSIISKAKEHFPNLEKFEPPKFHRPKVKNAGRERVLSRDERTLILETLLAEKKKSEEEKEYRARRRTGLLMYFSLMTAARHGDCAALEKSFYSESEHRLRVFHKKTGTWTIYQPVPKTIKWILAEADKLYPGGKYFFSERGKIHNKTYSILQRTCEDLKIPYGAKTDNGFVIHSLRHTVTTVLQHNRIDPQTTKSITGHRKLPMVEHYSHASDESRGAAVEVLERELSLFPRKNDIKAKEPVFRELFGKVKTGEISEDEFTRFLLENF